MQRHKRQIIQELDQVFDLFYVKHKLTLEQVLREKLRVEDVLDRERLFAALAPLRQPLNEAERKSLRALQKGEQVAIDDSSLEELIRCHEVVELQRAQVLSIAEDVGNGEGPVTFETIAAHCPTIFLGPHESELHQIIGSNKRWKADSSSAEVKARKWFQTILHEAVLKRDLKLSFLDMKRSPTWTIEGLHAAFENAGLHPPTEDVLQEMLRDAHGAPDFEQVFLFIKQNDAET